jgi:hypothetical protein
MEHDAERYEEVKSQRRVISMPSPNMLLALSLHLTLKTEAV